MTTGFEKTKVSVYCLAYNHEKYIRKAIDGLINQKTDFAYEIIIHDDASTDGTAAIIREYEERYPDLIKGIYQTENQYSGAGAIFKRFIEPKINGDYIGSCEGDDFWTDSFKLQKQFNALECHPECSVCLSRVDWCDENGNLIEGCYPDPSLGIHDTGVLETGFLASLLFEKYTYPFQTSSYLIRRSAMEQYPILNWSKNRKDREIMKSCLAAGPFYFIDESMSVWRQHYNNSWHSRYMSQKHPLLKLRRANAISDLSYNRFLSGRFHHYIRPTAFYYIILSSFLDIDETHDILHEYNFNFWEVFRNLPLKKKVKFSAAYFMFEVFPQLYVRHMASTGN